MAKKQNTIIYPANINDVVVLRTNYYDSNGAICERLTQHEILGHRVGYGEPCFVVMCANDPDTTGSNIDPISQHLIPWEALVQVLPKSGEQLMLF